MAKEDTYFEYKEKRSYLQLGWYLESFVQSHYVLSCSVISQVMLTDKVPVSSAQITGENKVCTLCGKLLLENFCMSLNLPVNQNLLSCPVKSQWDLLPLKFNLFFAPTGLLSSLFSSYIAPQWVVDLLRPFFPPSGVTILWLIELGLFNTWSHGISIVTALCFLSQCKNKNNNKLPTQNFFLLPLWKLRWCTNHPYF